MGLVGVESNDAQSGVLCCFVDSENERRNYLSVNSL
jgi:hypothetical protein